MLLCPTTELRFINASCNSIPQQPYEMYVRNCGGGDILFYLPTNKLARHRLMGVGRLLDQRQKTGISQTLSLCTCFPSSNSYRALQWWPGDFGFQLQKRSPKFRKPQTFLRAQKQSCRSFASEGTFWWELRTAKGNVSTLTDLYLPRLVRYANILEKVFWNKMLSGPWLTRHVDMRKTHGKLSLNNMFSYSQVNDEKTQVFESSDDLVKVTEICTENIVLCTGMFIVLASYR